MNLATAAKTASELHEEHEVSSVAFQSLVISLALAETSLWIGIRNGWLWLAGPLVLVVAHIMHGLMIGFHEASHGLLRKSRRLNEFDGVVIGVFSLISFSLYRAAHQSHHAYLAS